MPTVELYYRNKDHELQIADAIDPLKVFIPPSENPGLSSPGMNDTTSTERALALA